MPRLYFGSRGGVYYKKNGRKVYVNQFAADEGTPTRNTRKRTPPGAPKKSSANAVTRDMYNDLLNYVQCLLGALLNSKDISQPFILMLNFMTDNNILLQWDQPGAEIIDKYEQLHKFSQEIKQFTIANYVDISHCSSNPYVTKEQRRQNYKDNHLPKRPPFTGGADRRLIF